MFKNGKFPRWILLYVVAILFVAGTVNVLMYLAVPTLPDLNAPSWLGFWGSYLGGAIGCLPALEALYDNRREARRQHEESERSRRLAVMPVFDCRIRYVSCKFAWEHSSNFFLIDSDGVLRKADDYGDDTFELDQSPRCNYVDLCNCGLGPALQVKLFYKGHCVELFNLKNGDTAHYIFLPSNKYFFDSEAESTVQFTVESQDLYGNRYAQDLSFKAFKCFEGKIDYLSFQTESIGTAHLLSSSEN